MMQSMPILLTIISKIRLNNGDNDMNIRKIVAAGLLVMATPLTFAANIALYAQPNQSSQLVSKVQDSSNLIKIIKGKHGWVKVADKSNGQVGWVNSKPNHGQCHKKQKIEKMVNQLDTMQMQLQSQHQQFMAQFDAKMSQIDLQRQEAVKALNEINSNHGNVLGKKVNDTTQEPQSYSFSKSFSYTGGKDAKVTETIIKDGKKETKNYEVPVKQAN
jgi:hypothetical protein